jgi:hypothetical protein
MKIVKYINKFISISYYILTNVYNFFFSKYEEFLLKNNNFLKYHNLNLEGYCKILNLNIPIIDVNKLETNFVNKYYRRFILNNFQIQALIKNIFIETANVVARIEKKFWRLRRRYNRDCSKFCS